MARQQLKQTLETLHSELASDEAIATEDRAALMQTVREIEDALSRGDDEPKPATQDSLRRRISAGIERFEATHPRFAELLRSVSESLSNSGI